MEILLMGLSEVGEDACRGLYDVSQAGHLSGLADASLKEPHFAVLVQSPHTQRYANLGVIRAW